ILQSSCGQPMGHGPKLVCQTFALFDCSYCCVSVEHHLASNVQRNRLVQHDLQVAKRLQEEEDHKAQLRLQKRHGKEIEEQICNQIADRCKANRVVIMGDFNYPNIDLQNTSIKGKAGQRFIDCVQENVLEQYVSSPTRKEALPDLVLGNEIGQVEQVSVGQHLGNSDHNIIRFRLLMNRDKKRANFDGLKRDLELVTWQN
uniref:Coiled-coil domain-containing protein n=1 Tax=Callorhinchus milii TaxID=7868 RepID=A0A4W3GAF0_CALMI